MLGLLEQMRDGYIGKCSTMRLLRYRAPIAHSCSLNESILGTVLGVRDNGVYHLDSGGKGERMGATRGWGDAGFYGNANRKRNWSYMSPGRSTRRGHRSIVLSQFLRARSSARAGLGRHRPTLEH